MPPVQQVPDIDLTDPAVQRDPFAAYGAARERRPVARLTGFGPMWVVTRHEEARAMLTDPRLALGAGSYQRPEVPEHYVPYLRTMQEMEGEEHGRLRRLVSPAFSARRALEFRPRIERIVERLLAALPADGPVDLLRDFAQPLPMEVICELVGVPEDDRPRWHEYGRTVLAGAGLGFAAAVPGIIDGAREIVAGPGRDLVALLKTVDGLAEQELVTLVWQLVLAGQTPANLIANAIEALLAHPGELAALRADPALLTGAVDELIRWCGPALLTIPRQATEDLELHGVPVRAGEPVTASIAAVNRDPRVFDDPDRLDVRRAPAGHLGFAYGPHFCLGASLARVQTEVALGAVLRRFPALAIAEPGAHRAPDPGTWRLTALPVTG
ncbi:cytochrome P450 family protein [Amycolatopsis sp. NBC_01480]|uniref:cytochrome P450 family protein n=1 Tax=Amycolatopsis sp. NBC_01480 TaxID=2903562 RepID=UPI002E2B78FE|nr:cytochrome P450 [Amycolatopsis sp. NBC_01480]